MASVIAGFTILENRGSRIDHHLINLDEPTKMVSYSVERGEIGAGVSTEVDVMWARIGGELWELIHDLDKEEWVMGGKMNTSLSQ